MGENITTVADVPNDDEWSLVTGSHSVQTVLDHIGESDREGISLFVRTGEGEYTDVLAFAGNVPYLHKSVTRLL